MGQRVLWGMIDSFASEVPKLHQGVVQFLLTLDIPVVGVVEPGEELVLLAPQFLRRPPMGGLEVKDMVSRRDSNPLAITGMVSTIVLTIFSTCFEAPAGMCCRP